ncbi:ABC transporter permease [Luedemannella flava]|uniref:Transport permease protein n=1 Tax=Luedemannella flava TaxID=349316 RepID=A0ABN2LBG9_9ACTN
MSLLQLGHSGGPGALPEIDRLTPGQVGANIATLVHRNLLKFYRNRQLLLLSIVQPLTNMMLFAYVFNNVARIPGVAYRDYVIPGVLTQAVMVAAMRTGVAVSHDSSSGMNDRLRSLPIARSAALVGRTISDTIRISVQTAVLAAIAVIFVGFQFQFGALRAVASIGAIALFGLAVTSFAAWVGLTSRDPEAAQTMLITPTLPLVFGSSGFAPIDQMPGWLQAFARVNPVTSVVDLSRHLAVGGDLLTPFVHYALWTGGITILFTYLGVRRYQRP